MAVNLDGPYNMVTAFLEQLKATKGSVINIGSIQSFVALPNSAAYTTSKGGVRALTKALAIELSPQGVRVNAIGPGMIATPLNAWWTGHELEYGLTDCGAKVLIVDAERTAKAPKVSSARRRGKLRRGE